MTLKRASGQYIKGHVAVEKELTLLAEAPACNTCKACVYDSGMRYRYCFFTDELLPAFDKCIGAKCPVSWELE